MHSIVRAACVRQCETTVRELRHLPFLFLLCSKAATLLRALHIEGLPATVTASELSQLMSPYGNVQYAEVREASALDSIGL